MDLIALVQYRKDCDNAESWHDAAPCTSAKPAVPASLFDSFDATCTGPGYKYKEVVRKKEEREALLGVECQDCQSFYRACQTWGTLAPAAGPECGHAMDGDAPCQVLAGFVIPQDVSA